MGRLLGFVGPMREFARGFLTPLLGWLRNPNSSMRTLFCSSLIVLALVAHSQPGRAQSSIINSFSQNGVLVCSNLAPGSVAAVSWASSLAGPWQSNWTTLNAVTVGTNGTIRVAVPMFYRVLGVPESTNLFSVKFLQLWGGSNVTHFATNSIRQSSVPTPVNTASAVFDAAHTTIWIPVSYIPDWAVGAQVYWGSSAYAMRVAAVGAGQIQFHTLSGYFGWGPGNVISPTLSYGLSRVMTAAANWKSPGVGHTVVVTATAISAKVGNVVWAGGVGGDQFQIMAISP